MQVGIYVGFQRQPGDRRPLVDLYENHLKQARDAEQLGFDFVMASEHHFKEDQWNPSPLMLLAAIARETSVIKLGSNIYQTPFYSPLRLAEDIAVLDNLSNGRLSLLVPGSASMTREFETYGVEPSERFGRLWETLSFLRKAFTYEPFDHKGKYFRFPNVLLTTTTVQRPFPLWFGGFGLKMTARAAKEGYHYFGPNLDLYLSELARWGRNPNDYNTGVRGRFTVVATKAEVADAQVRAREIDARQRAEYNTAGRDLAFQFTGARTQEDSQRQGTIAGTPDMILAALEPIFKTSMFTYYELRGEGQELQLISKELLPTLKSWGREPVYSSKFTPEVDYAGFRGR